MVKTFQLRWSSKNFHYELNLLKRDKHLTENKILQLQPILRDYAPWEFTKRSLFAGRFETPYYHYQKVTMLTNI